MRSLTTVLLTVALFLGATASASSAETRTRDGATDGSVGIRLVDAPVAGRTDPRALIYIIDHLPPGGVIHRQVQVLNTSPTPQHVELYADSASLGNGQFTFGTTPNELTSWISFQRTGLDLSANSNATVTTTIQVPPRAAQGERYAVIWAQVSAPAGPQGNLGVINRVGVRIYLDVGPGGDPPSDFQIENLAAARAANGQPQVLAQVRNTGKRALDMSGSLTLSNGPASTSAGPFPATDGTTLGPGDSAPVTAVLDRQLSDGPWSATFTLDSGLVQHTARATLTFPVAPGTTSPVRVSLDRPSGRALDWPTILGVAGLILLSVTIWLLVDLRRRRTAPG